MIIENYKAPENVGHSDCPCLTDPQPAHLHRLTVKRSWENVWETNGFGIEFGCASLLAIQKKIVVHIPMAWLVWSFLGS